MSTDVQGSSAETISILAAPDAVAHGIRDFVRPADVSIDRLKDNLTSLIAKFSDILSDLPATGDFECSELTLTANVTAQGQVQLVGIAQAGGELQGGVTLTFTRRTP